MSSFREKEIIISTEEFISYSFLFVYCKSLPLFIPLLGTVSTAHIGVNEAFSDHLYVIWEPLC